jgi:hypothetical protein
VLTNQIPCKWATPSMVTAFGMASGSRSEDA